MSVWDLVRLAYDVHGVRVAMLQLATVPHRRRDSRLRRRPRAQSQHRWATSSCSVAWTGCLVGCWPPTSRRQNVDRLTRFDRRRTQTTSASPGHVSDCVMSSNCHTQLHRLPPSSNLNCSPQSINILILVYIHFSARMYVCPAAICKSILLSLFLSLFTELNDKWKCIDYL